MQKILKILFVILLCSVFYGKTGLPAACILFKFNFAEVFFYGCGGAIAGTIFFVYLFAEINRRWQKYLNSKQKNKSRKIFTKSRRRIIKLKHNFGLTGIAILAPILLSMPVGAFIADKFYKDKPKVILYLSLSCIGWTIILFYTYRTFYNSLKGIIF
ncbi:MAG: hypothetical protein JSU07_11560 [Bacteroidetes bacterium]|nr:hypothetical protein [Bacteroidota bacterium]